MRTRSLFPILFTFWLLPNPAAADDDPAACSVARPLTGQRLLRRLSLDLRGVTPTYEEALSLSGAEVPETTVDAYLRSPEFVEVMRRHHQSLLWPNLSQVELSPRAYQLFPLEVAPNDVIWLSPLRGVFVRTISGALTYPCRNEPAEFDASGQLIAQPLMMGGEIVAWQEGYVLVEPYWAPGTQIKVCGYDAQDALTATACPGPAQRFPFLAPQCEGVAAAAQSVQVPFTGAPIDCEGPFAIFAPGCGCGPNLRRCSTDATRKQLERSLIDQELRLIDRVVAEDRPYTEVVLTKEIDLNGPIAHYLRHQSRLSFDLFGDPDGTTPVPADLTYTSTPSRWVTVTRGERHSGVLTTPGYLMRFQSNRGRAHRFYNAFLCSSFIPAGPLPSPFEACSKHEDLTKRCGCNACHKALEPMAAHWGRFSEYGFTAIDEQLFPEHLGASCAPPFPSVERLFRCSRFYKIQAVGEELPFQYELNPYVFRTPDEVATIEAGPAHLAQEAIDSGGFAACTTRKLWTHLMRRPPTADEEASEIPMLSKRFAEGGHRLRALVKEIVEMPAYRRLP